MIHVHSLWRHIRRSPYQTFAAISNMMLTFAVGGFFVLLTACSIILLNDVEKKPQVVVFFNDTKKVEEITKLVDGLKNDPQVSSVKYVSKEEALDIYKNQFKDDPLLLEMVSSDILPASIEVSAVKLEYLNSLAENLKKEPDVTDIRFPKQVIDQLLSWVSVIRNVGLIIMVVLALVSVTTIVTIINMKIALKRDEIEILQLIGATPLYVSLPFLYEGMFYGIFGAIIGFIINVGFLLFAQSSLSTLFTGIPIFPIPILFYPFFFVGLVMSGGFLGLLSSLIAVNRYLR